MLLLAGFEWTVSAYNISIPRTLQGFDIDPVVDIQTALANASFPGWTVVRDDLICCPEPSSLTLAVAFSVVLFAKASRRCLHG